MFGLKPGNCLSTLGTVGTAVLMLRYFCITHFYCRTLFQYLAATVPMEPQGRVLAGFKPNIRRPF